VRRILFYTLIGVSLVACKSSSSGLSKAINESKAQGEDKSVQSIILETAANARTLYVDTQDWGAVTPATLQQAEPTYEYSAGPSTDKYRLSVVSSTTDGIVIAAKSKSGTCFVLRMVPPSGAQLESRKEYGKGPCSAADVSKVKFSFDVGNGWWN
jgi:hypothetical protein